MSPGDDVYANEIYDSMGRWAENQAKTNTAEQLSQALAEIERLKAALASRSGQEWQPIESFPQDGEAYLADDNRVAGGFPQVVFWEEDGRLHVPDARISYVPAFFTHWKKLDEPPHAS